MIKVNRLKGLAKIKFSKQFGLVASRKKEVVPVEDPVAIQVAFEEHSLDVSRGPLLLEQLLILRCIRVEQLEAGLEVGQ